MYFACSSTDVHTVASLLKLYLRQLPEPLVPYRRYQEFLLCGQRLSSDRTLVTTAAHCAVKQVKVTQPSPEKLVFADPQWFNFGPVAAVTHRCTPGPCDITVGRVYR